MKRTVREVRLLAAKFLLSCVLDIAPDSRFRDELEIWIKKYLENGLIDQLEQ